MVNRLTHWYRSRCRRPSLGIFRGLLDHRFIHLSVGVDDCLCGMQRMCHGPSKCEGSHIEEHTNIIMERLVEKYQGVDREPASPDFSPSEEPPSGESNCTCVVFHGQHEEGCSRKIISPSTPIRW